jgi:acetyl-CoA carboxylase alpha subunit
VEHWQLSKSSDRLLMFEHAVYTRMPRRACAAIFGGRRHKITGIAAALKIKRAILKT